MKKVLLCFICFILLCEISTAQETKRVRPAALGVSFILNDYKTAERIRSTSLSAVRRDNRWAKFTEQSPGMALTYFKGINPSIDFAGTLAASYATFALPDKPAPSSEALIMELDASANFKLFPEGYTFTPYAIIGTGISLHRSSWGAFMPVGAGLKLNLFNESDIFVTFQYRIPVTTQNSASHFFTSIGITGLLGGDKEQ